MPPFLSSVIDGQSLTMLRGQDPCIADRAKMPLIGAAAPSQYIQCRQRNAQASVAVTQIDRVTDIQLGRCVQLGVAAGRRIGTESANACRPIATHCDASLEVTRVSAVHPKV